MSHLRTLTRGERVWHCGEPSTRLAFLLEGRVKLERAFETGRELMLDFVEGGELLCGAAVCARREYCCEAVVASPEARVLSVPRVELLGALFGDRPAAHAFLADLSQRGLEMCGRLAEVGGRGAAARVAALFLRLGRCHGMRALGSDSLRLPLRLSRRDVAELCGITTETAIRLLVELEKRGAIVRDAHGFRLDEPALRELTSAAPRGGSR